MTKSTVEAFLNRSKEPKHVDEAKLAAAYIKADRDLGEQKIRLMACLSAAEVDGKVIPVFDEDVAEVLEPLSVAQKNASTVKKDVERYLSLLEDQPSIAAMTESLGRIRIVVRNAEFDSKALLERQVRGSEKSAAECMTLPDVVDSFAHSEKVAKENQPSIDDLLARIAEAKTILESYK
ncbi:MAG: hypothetical protein ABR985_22820 [Methanotrichaceae archaeon]|jgi:microcompartment protein CcmL/EutN